MTVFYNLSKNWPDTCLKGRHMFGAIAKLFGKRSTPATPEAAPSPAPAKVSQPLATADASRNPAQGVSKIETPAVPVMASQPRAATGGRPGPQPFGNQESIRIPFASILRGVPQDLWGKLAPAGAAGQELVLAKTEVLAQLPQGAVKVSLSSLRQSAPVGLFAANPARDSQLIDLPLKEILDQLRPETLTRRASQGRVHVSEEVPDIFGARGENLSALRVMEKGEVTAVRTVSPAPAPAPAAPEPPPAWAPIPMTTPPAGMGPVPARAITPVAPPSIQQPPPPRVAPSEPARTPAAGLPPVPSIRFGASPAPAPAPAPSAPLKPAPLTHPNTPPAGTFLIGLKDVAEHWPEEIRTALAQLKVPDSKLALPAVEVCEGLKRRLVQFPWGTLRRWVYPQAPSSAPSPLDDTVLTLPLDQLTPLFLDFIRSSPAHRKVADSRTITEFFRRAEVESRTVPAVSEPAPSNIIPLPTAGSPAPAPAGPANLEGSMDLPLGPISSNWPAEVRSDIEEYKLTQSVVSLPLEYVDAGLKTGRVEFSWRQVLAWLRPAPGDAQLTSHGELRVAFPLAVVAPLFLRKTGGNQPRRKAAVDQSIPDLFSAGGVPNPAATAPVPPPAAPAPAPVPPPPPAPAPAVITLPHAVADAATAAAAAAAAPRKPGPKNLAEVFNEPGKRTWTPNDIVHYSARLPGVAGALIALQDGLLVAAALPPTLRAEPIAAFVPQIFGRMNQYTRELQLGEAQGVSYTVASGTLVMYSAGLIYYVVLGKPDATLPFSDLQFIARELTRHTK